MTDIHEKKMTAKEWREAEKIESELAYADEQTFLRCYEIYPELDYALGNYMAALGDPGARAAAINRFDAALVQLRKFYREGGWDWEGYVADPYVFRS
jgi:hypothetical protein